MVANVRGYTDNYKFKLINFDTPRWHTLEYANWTLLDALLRQAYVPTVRGEWITSTDYVVGDRVVDTDTGELYRCEVNHTSAATGTFAADRAANPTFWVLHIPGIPTFVGAWTPLTVYAQGDIVTVTDYVYYLCHTAHTSGAAFAPDAANWALIFDATQVVADAQAFANAAEASQITASASEVDAEAAAVAAQLAADAARGAQGSFIWLFDDQVAEADPGIGKVRFNNAVPANITAIFINAQSQDTGNPDVSDWINTWDNATNPPSKGTLYIRKVNLPQDFMIFNVTGNVTDSGTWLKSTIAYLTHSGLFTDDEEVFVSFVTAGNQGASGAGSGDLVAANNLSDVADAPTAAENLGVGATDTPTFAQVSLTDAPTINAHAASKLYVDGEIATLAGDVAVDVAAVEANANSRVLKAGDTMTGHLVLPAGPGATNAVRKDYVDAADTTLNAAIAEKLSTSGGAMTGPLLLQADPAAAVQAATKNYVDNRSLHTRQVFTTGSGTYNTPATAKRLVLRMVGAGGGGAGSGTGGGNGSGAGNTTFSTFTATGAAGAVGAVGAVGAIPLAGLPVIRGGGGGNGSGLNVTRGGDGGGTPFGSGGSGGAAGAGAGVSASANTGAGGGGGGVNTTPNGGGGGGGGGYLETIIETPAATYAYAVGAGGAGGGAGTGGAAGGTGGSGLIIVDEYY